MTEYIIDKVKIQELIDKYNTIKSYGKLKDYNEERTKKDFILPLFQALGWKTDTDEVTAEEAISKDRVDYGFYVNGIPKFYLEAKPIRESNLPVNEKYIKQAINYAWNKACTWAVLTNFEVLIVFNAELNPKKALTNWFIRSLSPENLLKDETRLNLLSKQAIENGELDKFALSVGKEKPRLPIDKQLLNDFMHFREILSKNMVKDNSTKTLSGEDIDEAVQRVLDRLIFIRNAEDRGLERNQLRSNLREWKDRGKGNLIKEINKVYREYDAIYNSKLFSHHLCDEFELDDDTLGEVIEGLYSSRDENYSYDFSAIEANVLGNIYEQYLGSILNKTKKSATLKESHSHRKEQGIYYTPNYIVDYIVKNTVGELLKDKKIDVSKIHILDPACGSGSFLMKAYDTLENYYYTNKPKELKTQKLDLETNEATYSKKVEILKNSIFGVDLDSKATEIAQLNLLLQISEKGKRLPTLQGNIKIGNSLIGDTKVAKDKAFNWSKEFGSITNGGGFDIIIGNPPYVKIHKIPKSDSEFYRKTYYSADKQFDLFCLFLERGISLLKEGGLLGFIIPSLLFRGYQYNKTRDYILKTSKIKSVFELGDKIFQNVQMPTSIIILEKYSNENQRLKNKYFVRIKRGKTLVKFTETKKEQKDLYLTNNNSIETSTNAKSNEISNKFTRDTTKLDNLVYITRGLELGKKSKGILKNSDSKEDIPILAGEDIERYRIKNVKFIKKDVFDEFTKSKKIFETEKLLIRETGKRITLVYDDSGLLNLRTLYNIINRNGSKIKLKFLLGILNSKLIEYYYITKFKASTDVFPKIRIGQVKELPIKIEPEQTQQKLIDLVDKIISLNKELDKTTSETNKKDRIIIEINKVDSEIDEFVYNIYNIDEEEQNSIETTLSDNEI